MLAINRSNFGGSDYNSSIAYVVKQSLVIPSLSIATTTPGYLVLILLIRFLEVYWSIIHE